jgi:hypothetical protein
MSRTLAESPVLESVVDIGNDLAKASIMSRAQVPAKTIYIAAVRILVSNTPTADMGAKSFILSNDIIMSSARLM